MKYRGWLTVAAAVAVLVITGMVMANNAPPPMTENLEWKGRIVVEFREALGPIRLTQNSGLMLTGDVGLDALAHQFNVHHIEKLIPFAEKPQDPAIRDISRYYILHFPFDTDLHEVAQAYALDPNVITAEPYMIRRADWVPNDPMYFSQWAMNTMHANLAFDYCQGSDTVIIGVVDSGIDTTHQDLRNNLWINPEEDLNGNGIIDPSDWDGQDNDGNSLVDDFWGWNFWQGNNDVQDNQPQGGHGTHCSGLASGVTNNGMGIASLACKTKILTSRCGDGEFVYSWTSGVAYAAGEGAHIISMSFGGTGSSGYEQSIINNAYSQGAALFASAGNTGQYEIRYPSGYDNVVSVAASNSGDHKAGFSTYAPTVDVAAPGEGILSTVPYSYTSFSGTSMSTPIAASLAAQIWAARPAWTNTQVIQQIYDTCVPIDVTGYAWSGFLGHGRIDAGAAITALFPTLSFTETTFQEVTGNGDTRIDPGETWKLLITVNNSSRTVAANGVVVDLTCNNTNVSFSQGTCNLGSIGTQSSQNNATSPFTFSVDAGAPPFEATFTLSMNETTLMFPITQNLLQMVGVPDVLLVDDDGGVNWQVWYEMDLDSLAIVYDYWNVSTQGEVDFEIIQPYSKVIWHTSTEQNPLTENELAAIGSYINSTGCLFLTGQNIDEQLDSSAAYGDVLHASAAGLTPAPMVFGVDGDPISSGTSMMLAGAGGAGNAGSSATINAVNDAVLIYNYGSTSGPGAGLRWDHQTGGLVYLAFNFEASSGLPGYTNRRIVLQNIFDWFDSLVLAAPTVSEPVLPADYALDQNYPNPFNPGTEITFSLPKAERVKLSVFDLSGRLVATLVNGQMPAGRHTAAFQAPDLASGVYLYRLETGAMQLTRKMVLLK
ncbi:MAG: T9SS C-terminal target domain-containing protein [Candidatus Zixiibacteriota bacterium]|nr:MAG: T9SS C-terminal target domain-containing protein [candidate division Zixibacteria bacterium]